MTHELDIYFRRIGIADGLDFQVIEENLRGVEDIGNARAEIVDVL